MATIGIIMPCYYNSDVIRPALEMLSWQTKKDEIEVIMINDCSPNTDCEYEDLRKEFSSELNIKYLKTEKTCGPNISRQLGLNNCDCDWVLFHGETDILANPSVIEEYLKIINQDIEYSKIIGQIFINNNYLPPEKNESILGCLYNNKYIKNYNIQFHSFLQQDGDIYFDINYYIVLNKLDLINIYFLNKKIYKKINNEYSISENNLIWFLMTQIELLKFYEENLTDYIQKNAIFIELLFPALELILQTKNQIKTIDDLDILFQMLNQYFTTIFPKYENEIKIFKQNNFNLIENTCQMLDFYQEYSKKCIIDFSYYKDQLLNFLPQCVKLPIKLSIIIPCYYDFKTIYPCFKSLWEQTKKDEIEIIMINDCSPNTDCEYEDLRILCLQNNLNVKYLKTEKNSGPGIVRQLGIDNCDKNSKYVMFMDDDDHLYNNQVLENIFNVINNNEQVGLIRGGRLEYDNKNIQKDAELTGLTGSIFSLGLIKIGNIVFEDIMLDEDTLFFIQYTFFLNQVTEVFNFNITILDSYIYCYQLDNFKSITHNIETQYEIYPPALELFQSYQERFYYRSY